MIPFALDEIEFLISVLGDWEDRAANELIAEDAKRDAQIAFEEIQSGATDEEREELFSQLAAESLTRYTPEKMRKLTRERNEDSVLLRAKLITRRREIEKRVAEGVVEEVVKGLFGKEGDESDV